MIRVVVRRHDESDVLQTDVPLADRPEEGGQRTGPIRIDEKPAGAVDKICVCIAVFDWGEHEEIIAEGMVSY